MCVRSGWVGENLEPCATQNVTNLNCEMIQHVCAQRSLLNSLSVQLLLRTCMCSP